LAAALLLCQLAGAPRAASQEEMLVTAGEVGRPGGRIVVSLRAEPKTLNPLTAADGPSREIISLMQADLIHINRGTQLCEPALAKAWKVSRDGLEYTLKVRRGLRFSDGHPVDIDDVLFTFRVYLDESVHATQREQLIVGGKPIAVRKIDSETLEFHLSKPNGAGERLFDGFAVLPRHLLETAYNAGKLGQAGTLDTAASQWGGLGPFRLKEYVPGQRLVLERNPFYWKADQNGHHLPYLDEIVFLFVPSADAQVLRFQSGETDMISRVGAENFSALARQNRGYTMTDSGPGLEYNFLFFNLNVPGPKASAEQARRQRWFADERFRHAVSAAVDRQAIVRLVYQGRGAPLWGPVTPGNPRWLNTAVSHPARSLDVARQFLQQAGFRLVAGNGSEPQLVDSDSRPVEFTIITSSSNADRSKMATLIQDDLKQLGMRVQIVPLELRSLIDRVTQTKEYDACVLGIVSADADPTPELNVLLSSGQMHLWNPAQEHPATEWEAQIDRLMEQQLETVAVKQRKALYDRVQQLLADHAPMIFLASPNILVGAKNSVGNFHPAVLEPYVLWNAEQLYQRTGAGNARQ
jgi:peptide/nickel transport system substrate-binding protein